MKKPSIKRIFYPLFFVLAFLAWAPPVISDRTTVYAQSSSAQCRVNTGSWQQINCQDLVALYPSFQPRAGSCYWSWGTGFGPTSPVSVNCNNPPASDSPIIRPANNTPGSPPAAQAATPVDANPGSGGGSSSAGPAPTVTGGNHYCGAPDRRVEIAINIGCRGQGNAVLDMIFAFIRFLSIGVGVVIIGSVVFAGIQYTSSAGDPNKSAQAIKRIQSSLLSFLLFIFAYAILNWLVPAGLL